MKKVKVMFSVALLFSVMGVGLLSTAFTPSASALPPACNCNLPKWEYGIQVDSDCQALTCDVIN